MGVVYCVLCIVYSAPGHTQNLLWIPWKQAVWVWLRIVYCVLCIGAQASIDRGCVLRIAHPHCVLEVWQVLGGPAYCALCICIVYWRFGRYWDGLRIAYCVSVLRIGGWGVIGTGCVLRIAYPYCVLESFGRECVLRIVYPYCVPEVWDRLRIAYCVSVLCIGGLGRVAYCVLRIRIVYRRFGTGCVLCTVYPYCVSEARPALICTHHRSCTNTPHVSL